MQCQALHAKWTSACARLTPVRCTGWNAGGAIHDLQESMQVQDGAVSMDQAVTRGQISVIHSCRQRYEVEDAES